MLKISDRQMQVFDAAAGAAFESRLTAFLAEAEPGFAASVRADAARQERAPEQAPERDPFAAYVLDAIESAEDLEMATEAEAAVFARLLILVDLHAETHPAPFSYAYQALSREGPGRVRLALIEDRFAEMAEADPALAPLPAALAAAREHFA